MAEFPYGHDENRAFQTLTYETAPDYLRHNHFIRTGYRFQSTPRQCLSGLFRLHNQTTNIHTHLAAWLYFGYLLYAVYYGDLGPLPPKDRLILSLEILAQMLLFFCSAFFHTFDAHSREGYAFLVKIDYAGIILAFSASLAVFSHYAFACQPAVSLGYVAFFIAVGGPAAGAVLAPRLAKPEYRGVRSAVFGVTIGSGLVAVTHFAWSEVISHHWESPVWEHMFPVLKLCLFSYFLQFLLVVTYVARIPERWIQSPKIDIWLHSHTLVHVLCFASSLVWFHAILAVRRGRLAMGCRAIGH